MTPDKTEAGVAGAVPPGRDSPAAGRAAPPNGAGVADTVVVTGDGAGAGGSGAAVAPQGEPFGEMAAGPQGGGAMRAARRRGTMILQRYSLVALLGVSIGVYGIWGKTSAVFLSAADFRNIASSQAVLVVLTLGLIIPMISGSLDLSIGNAAGLSSVATAAFYAHGHVPLLVGALLGIVVGALIGVVNGLLARHPAVPAVVRRREADRHTGQRVRGRGRRADRLVPPGADAVRQEPARGGLQ